MNSKIIVDLSIVENNIKRIVNNCKNISFIYPVKCINNKKIIQLMIKYNFGFDLSNMNEYKCISKLINNNTLLSFSGPKSEYITTNDISQSSIIFLDNLNSQSAKMLISQDNYGIRINFNNDKDFEPSRFGIPLEEICKYSSDIKHVHFHIHDKNKDLLLDKILEKIDFIISVCPNLKTINIGGHYEYYQQNVALGIFNNIRQVIPDKIQLIVEAAGLWFERSIFLETHVISIKNINGTSFIVLDVCSSGNLFWSKPRIDKRRRGEFYTIFCGASCDEHDIICSEYTDNKFDIGDIVSFYNISPYSYVWNREFNGLKKIKYKIIN